jgi:hypothetical protein
MSLLLVVLYYGNASNRPTASVNLGSSYTHNLVVGDSSTNGLVSVVSYEW